MGICKNINSKNITNYRIRSKSHFSTSQLPTMFEITLSDKLNSCSIISLISINSLTNKHDSSLNQEFYKIISSFITIFSNVLNKENKVSPLTILLCNSSTKQIENYFLKLYERINNELKKVLFNELANISISISSVYVLPNKILLSNLGVNQLFILSYNKNQREYNKKQIGQQHNLKNKNEYSRVVMSCPIILKQYTDMTTRCFGLFNNTLYELSVQPEFFEITENNFILFIENENLNDFLLVNDIFSYLIETIMLSSNYSINNKLPAQLICEAALRKQNKIIQKKEAAEYEMSKKNVINLGTLTSEPEREEKINFSCLVMIIK